MEYTFDKLYNIILYQEIIVGNDDNSDNDDGGDRG